MEEVGVCAEEGQLRWMGHGCPCLRASWLTRGSLSCYYLLLVQPASKALKFSADTSPARSTDRHSKADLSSAAASWGSCPNVAPPMPRVSSSLHRFSNGACRANAAPVLSTTPLHPTPHIPSPLQATIRRLLPVHQLFPNTSQLRTSPDQHRLPVLDDRQGPAGLLLGPRVPPLLHIRRQAGDHPEHFHRVVPGHQHRLREPPSSPSSTSA